MMAYAPKNPNGPVTSGQTFGLFKICKKDYRDDISSRQINSGQFATLMNDVYEAARASGWKKEVAQARAEQLLANYPPAA